MPPAGEAQTSQVPRLLQQLQCSTTAAAVLPMHVQLSSALPCRMSRDGAAALPTAAFLAAVVRTQSVLQSLYSASALLMLAIAVGRP